MTGTIYLITNTVNGKQYVGQTWRTLEQRWQEHRYKASSKDTAIANAIRKYGADAFTINVIFEKVAISQWLLDIMEESAIKVYDTLSPKGYNLDTGGKGGRCVTESTRKKLSENAKNRTYSQKTRKKMSDSAKCRTGESAARYRPDLREPGVLNEMKDMRRKGEYLHVIAKRFNAGVNTIKRILDSHGIRPE